MIINDSKTITETIINFRVLFTGKTTQLEIGGQRFDSLTYNAAPFSTAKKNNPGKPLWQGMVCALRIVDEVVGETEASARCIAALTAAVNEFLETSDPLKDEFHIDTDDFELTLVPTASLHEFEKNTSFSVKNRDLVCLWPVIRDFNFANYKVSKADAIMAIRRNIQSSEIAQQVRMSFEILDRLLKWVGDATNEQRRDISDRLIDNLLVNFMEESDSPESPRASDAMNLAGDMGRYFSDDPKRTILKMDFGRIPHPFDQFMSGESMVEPLAPDDAFRETIRNIISSTRFENVSDSPAPDFEVHILDYPNQLRPGEGDQEEIANMMGTLRGEFTDLIGDIRRMVKRGPVKKGCSCGKCGKGKKDLETLVKIARSGKLPTDIPEEYRDDVMRTYLATQPGKDTLARVFKLAGIHCPNLGPDIEELDPLKALGADFDGIVEHNLPFSRVLAKHFNILPEWSVLCEPGMSFPNKVTDVDQMFAELEQRIASREAAAPRPDPLFTPADMRAILEQPDPRITEIEHRAGLMLKGLCKVLDPTDATPAPDQLEIELPHTKLTIKLKADATPEEVEAAIKCLVSEFEKAGK